jgi:hypothetical protein
MSKQWVTIVVAAAWLTWLPSLVSAQTASRVDQLPEVRGLVVDMESGRVAGAALHFGGQGNEYDAKTIEDGSYVVRLKPGVYTVRVYRFGFCEGRRGSFSLTENLVLNLDFQLIPCDIVDPVATGDGGSSQRGGSIYDPYREDRRGGYRYEELELPPGAKVSPLIAFGGRDTHSGIVVYIGQVVHGKFVPVRLTYDRYTLSANSIRYSRDGPSFIAEGDVVWRDGTSSVSGSKFEVVFNQAIPVARRYK